MKPARLWLIGVALAGAVVGCATVPPPPAEGPVLTEGTRLGFASEDIVHGREIYTVRCCKCHSLVAPQQRDPDEWEDILPVMTKKARLESTQAAQVRAYILAANAGAPLMPKPEKH